MSVTPWLRRTVVFSPMLSLEAPQHHPGAPLRVTLLPMTAGEQAPEGRLGAGDLRSAAEVRNTSTATRHGEPITLSDEAGMG